MQACKLNKSKPAGENSTPDSRTSRGQIALMLAFVLLAAGVLLMPVKRPSPPAAAHARQKARPEMNTQIVRGAPAVQVSLPTQAIPAGQTPPAADCFSVWEGNTQVVPDTPYDGAGATVQGMTIGPFSTSPYRAQVSISSGSPIPNYTGATILANSGTQGYGLTVATVDIVSKIVLEPLPPSNAPAYASTAAGNVTLNNVPAFTLSGQPESFTFVGAGSGLVNGKYVIGPPPDNKANQSAEYTNGQSWVTAYSTKWYNTSQPNGNGTLLYGNQTGSIYNASSGYNSFPTDQWATGSLPDGSVASGTAPGPTVSNIVFSQANRIDVQRAPDAGNAPGTPSTVGSNVTPSADFADTSAAGLTTYWYRYVEINDAGSSPGPWSRVTTSAAPTAPATSGRILRPRGQMW